MLTAENIQKAYKSGNTRLQILKGIGLKVEEGRFAVIVGPSGAGKSTLLHILGGLDRPCSGRVIFQKLDLYGTGQSRLAALRNKNIGFVFQFYHLLPEFTALENVLLPALIRKKSTENRVQRTEKAKNLLKTVGLADRMKHGPNQLSGGERQRAAIARALVNSPKILFCDEPTGNLDSRTAGGIIDLLLRLNREENLTCVMVTHEEGLARDAQAVYHMMDGRII